MLYLLLFFNLYKLSLFPPQLFTSSYSCQTAKFYPTTAFQSLSFSQPSSSYTCFAIQSFFILCISGVPNPWAAIHYRAVAHLELDCASPTHARGRRWCVQPHSPLLRVGLCTPTHTSCVTGVVHARICRSCKWGCIRTHAAGTAR